MRENTILRKNRQGLKALTILLSFPTAEIVELAAQAGFDAISLDGEHGAFGPESVDLMCRVADGCGLTVVARVPWVEPAMINLWLDRGVQGITGPRVESAAQARALANACLYPPEGTRSWGWGRGSFFNDAALYVERFGSRDGFSRWANENVLSFAQIETKAGYDHLDEILAVPGLTGITGGPNDFSASLGYPNQPDHPERVRLTDDAERRTRAAGKVVASDLTVGINLHEWVLEAGRDFVAAHRADRIG